MINRMLFIFESLIFTIFLIIFFIVLITFDIIQRVGGFFGRKGIEITELWLNKAILNSLKITGAKIDFVRNFPIPEEGPYVVISNHQSMFDISTIYVGLSEIAPRFVSKIELAKWIPSISTCLRLSKAALIDRSNPNQAINEITRFGDFIKQIKASAVIFPEGTRGLDGKIKKFKQKGSIALIEKCLPCWIIPVTIDGSWKLQSRKRGPIPWGTKIHFFSLKPIYITEVSKIIETLDEVENQITQKIKEIRTGIT